MSRHGSSDFCGVAQVVVPRSHKPVGGGASPPATSIAVVSTGVRPGLISPGELPDQRRRLGSTPRTTTDLPVARGISGTVLRTRLAVARLHSRVPIEPTPTDFGAGPPKAGCECSSHSVG